LRDVLAPKGSASSRKPSKTKSTGGSVKPASKWWTESPISKSLEIYDLSEFTPT